jgi:Ornithine/acetylornithine aminotransferase
LGWPSIRVKLEEGFFILHKLPAKKMLPLRQLFLRHVAQTSLAPLAIEVVRAEGVYLYDAEGKSYIDLIAA